MTRHVIKWTCVVVSVVHILLWLIDGFPFLTTLFAIVTHGVYASMLTTFPDVPLSSPSFIASCVAFVLNNYTCESTIFDGDVADVTCAAFTIANKAAARMIVDFFR